MNPFVNKIYLINMDKDKYRLELAKKELDKHNLLFEHFSGIDPKIYDKNKLKKYVTPKCEILCPYGVIGCGISHIKIWENIIKNNYKNTIIFEDDIILHSKFNIKLEKIIAELPNDYDILYLGSIGLDDRNIKKDILSELLRTYRSIIGVLNNKVSTNKYIKIPEYPLGMHGYMISNEGCKKLLKYFNNIKLSTHIDYMIATNAKNMNIYVCQEHLANQNFDIPSTIQDTSFPRLLNTILNKIKTYNNKPYSHSFGTSIFRLHTFNFTAYHILILIMGLLSIKYPYMFYLLLGIISLDIFLFDIKVIQALIVFGIGKYIIHLTVL